MNHSRITNLYAVLIPRLAAPSVAALTLKPGSRININKAHEMLGHVSENYLRQTATKENWILVNYFKVFNACYKAKAHQMNFPQAVSHMATQPAERLFLDISSVNHRSLGGNKFWLLIVDYFTRMKWYLFFKAKSDLSSTVLHFLAKLQRHNYNPHIICLVKI